ncbi:hypothetical protein ACQKKX_00820 [Neorhizobium sp. NPDC001467]|uniref:hypothetical protein n=1 Tax=Neorhizobium sp. NPDC001467 TaxID=3390595 RepID=UPI003CFEFCCE
MPSVRNQQRAHETEVADALRPEIRAALPDVSDPEVKARIAKAIAAMDPDVEAESLRWIESVSLFDNEDRDLE